LLISSFIKKIILKENNNFFFLMLRYNFLSLYNLLLLILHEDFICQKEIFKLLLTINIFIKILKIS